MSIKSVDCIQPILSFWMLWMYEKQICPINGKLINKQLTITYDLSNAWIANELSCRHNAINISMLYSSYDVELSFQHLWSTTNAFQTYCELVAKTNIKVGTTYRCLILLATILKHKHNTF